jgi:hypothetical protein
MKPNFALHTTQTDRSSALGIPKDERAAPEVHSFTAAAANSLVHSELLPQVLPKDRVCDANDRPTAIDAFVDDPPRPLPPPEPPPGAFADHTSAHLLSAASLTPRLSTPTLYPPVTATTAHARPSQHGCTIDCPLWCLIPDRCHCGGSPAQGTPPSPSPSSPSALLQIAPASPGMLYHWVLSSAFSSVASSQANLCSLLYLTQRRCRLPRRHGSQLNRRLQQLATSPTRRLRLPQLERLALG